MAYLSIPRCNEAGCNSSTDGSFRSPQFLHFHFQPPDKLSGRCLHRRYFSPMQRWAEDWQRRGGRGSGGAEEGRGARGRLPVKLRLKKTEVDVGRNQRATAWLARRRSISQMDGLVLPRSRWDRRKRASRCAKENSLPLALLACKLIGPI